MLCEYPMCSPGFKSGVIFPQPFSHLRSQQKKIHWTLWHPIRAYAHGNLRAAPKCIPMLTPAEIIRWWVIIVPQEGAFFLTWGGAPVIFWIWIWVKQTFPETKSWGVRFPWYVINGPRRSRRTALRSESREKTSEEPQLSRMNGNLWLKYRYRRKVVLQATCFSCLIGFLKGNP